MQPISSQSVVRRKIESIYPALLRDSRIRDITAPMTHRHHTEVADWVDAAVAVTIEKADRGEIHGPISEALLFVFVRRTVYFLVRTTIAKERRRIILAAGNGTQEHHDGHKAEHN
jgi:hypothetical protein